MAQQGAHVVELTMARPGIAPRAVNLFHNDGGFGESESRATVLLRDKGRHPASLSQGIDELFWVAARFVYFAKVLVGELFAEISDGVTNVLVLV